MTLVVATRMKVARARDVPAFFAMANAAARQSQRSPGFLGGRLRVERGRTFWTMSMWASGADMAAYRDSGVHREALPRLAGWAEEAFFTAWSAPDTDLPRWKDLREKLPGRPIFAELRNPTPAHRRQEMSRPSRVALLGRPLAPARRRDQAELTKG
jgi:heme-degrading monooxygenase HmoA